MVSNCIREPHKWEKAAVNSLCPGVLSPPTPCWGHAVPFVAVSVDFKGLTGALRVLICLHNRAVFTKAQPSGELEVFKDHFSGALLHLPCTGGVK